MTVTPLDSDCVDETALVGRVPARFQPRASIDDSGGPTVDELLRSGWQADAGCLGADPDAWFQDQGGVFPVAARRICAACPVARHCLAWALVFGEDHGIWGGLPPRRRKSLVALLDAGTTLGDVLDIACEATAGSTWTAA